jgi:hypothetical protein
MDGGNDGANEKRRTNLVVALEDFGDNDR